jgi:hypothetical protein
MEWEKTMRLVNQENVATQVAFGWGLLLLEMTLSLAVMIVDNIFMSNNFAQLRKDPGPNFMPILLYVFGLYALMPIYVFLVDRIGFRLFRWIAVAVGIFMFLFFLMHHVSHWRVGERPTFASHILDLTIDITGLWVAYNSIRWALARKPDPIVEAG